MLVLYIINIKTKTPKKICFLTKLTTLFSNISNMLSDKSITKFNGDQALESFY